MITWQCQIGQLDWKLSFPNSLIIHKVWRNPTMTKRCRFRYQILIFPVLIIFEDISPRNVFKNLLENVKQMWKQSAWKFIFLVFLGGILLSVVKPKTKLNHSGQSQLTSYNTMSQSESESQSLTTGSKTGACDQVTFGFSFVSHWF